MAYAAECLKNNFPHSGEAFSQDVIQNGEYGTTTTATINTFGFSLTWSLIFPEITPGYARSPILCELLMQDFLQAGCPSCHQTNSCKALSHTALNAPDN